MLLIFVDLRTVLLERNKHFVFAQERKRNFIEQIASIVMNIFIFFQEKISDLYIVENRVCVNLWSSELAKLKHSPKRILV